MLADRACIQQKRVLTDGYIADCIYYRTSHPGPGHLAPVADSRHSLEKITRRHSWEDSEREREEEITSRLHPFHNTTPLGLTLWFCTALTNSEDLASEGGWRWHRIGFSALLPNQPWGNLELRFRSQGRCRWILLQIWGNGAPGEGLPFFVRGAPLEGL